MVGSTGLIKKQCTLGNGPSSKIVITDKCTIKGHFPGQKISQAMTQQMFPVSNIFTSTVYVETTDHCMKELLGCNKSFRRKM